MKTDVIGLRRFRFLFLLCFAEHLRREREKWGRLVRGRNILVN